MIKPFKLSCLLILAWLTFELFTASREISNVIPGRTDIREEVSVDSLELQSFWQTCIVPIINLDSQKMRTFVHFPLEGDWGHMIGLKKPHQQWKQEDFFNNLNGLFEKARRDSLREQTWRDIHPGRQDNGEIILDVSVGYVAMIDLFQAESTDIYRFRKIEGKWMLCVIFHAG